MCGLRITQMIKPSRLDPQGRPRINAPVATVNLYGLYFVWFVQEWHENQTIQPYDLPRFAIGFSYYFGTIEEQIIRLEFLK